MVMEGGCCKQGLVYFVMILLGSEAVFHAETKKLSEIAPLYTLVSFMA